MKQHRITKSRGRNRTHRMGQNFLSSRKVAASIVDSLGDLSASHVLEIGPGRGALTGLLAERAARLTAVELDRRLASLSAAEFVDNERTEIVHFNALRFDMVAWARSCAPLIPVVAGNIPYSITNDLLHKLIGSHEELGQVVLMVQQEVARKITAPAGGKPYGMISVLCAYHARAEYLFTVGRGNFVPSPRVDSAVIRLDFNSPVERKANDYGVFNYLVRRLFDERRKQVQKVLRKGSRFSIDADAIDRIAQDSGVKLSRRPEELTVDEFVRLADVLHAWEATT